jgi:hypothetical protein
MRAIELHCGARAKTMLWLFRRVFSAPSPQLLYSVLTQILLLLDEFSVDTVAAPTNLHQ